MKGIGPVGDADSGVTSSVRLAANWRKGLAWALLGSSLFVWASAAPTGYWWGAIVMTGILLLIFLPIMLMRVTVKCSGSVMSVRLFPFVSLSFVRKEIRSIARIPGSESATSGIGIRRLEKKSWALLVGGPAVRVHMASRPMWTVSTADPDHVIAWFEDARGSDSPS